MECQWNPKLCSIRESKSLRHDSDNRHILPVDLDRAADYGDIGVERSIPQPIGDHGYSH
jgi:hypothetical protein